jgi:hypothetical protein
MNSVQRGPIRLQTSFFFFKCKAGEFIEIEKCKVGEQSPRVAGNPKRRSPSNFFFFKNPRTSLFT